MVRVPKLTARSAGAKRPRPPGPGPGGRHWSSRKPSSVSPSRGRWSSVWDGRRRPPRAAYPRLSPREREIGVGRTSPPIWPCSDWGLPCHRCYQRRGGLLPHRFTLTLRHPLTRASRGGLFSVALSVALRRPGVTWQSTLWSSDFPRGTCGAPRPSRSASVGKIVGDHELGKWQLNSYQLSAIGYQLCVGEVSDS